MNPDLSPTERVENLERYLRDHGVLADGEVDAALVRGESAVGDAPSPAFGARVVARAWTDRVFHDRLLDDAVGALTDLRRFTVPVAVLEDTPTLHHVIVCTLCSCYPAELLGPPPAWYKSFAYRSRVVREPRAVLAEFGTKVPEGVELQVHDSTAEQR